MKTKIIIEVETTKLKPYIVDGEDITDEEEKEWHEAIFNKVEDWFNDEDNEFQMAVMNNWIHTVGYLNPKAKRFSDIGDLRISISQEKEP